jgi:hypothetical protein
VLDNKIAVLHIDKITMDCLQMLFLNARNTSPLQNKTMPVVRSSELNLPFGD